MIPQTAKLSFNVLDGTSRLQEIQEVKFRFRLSCTPDLGHYSPKPLKYQKLQYRDPAWTHLINTYMAIKYFLLAHTQSYHQHLALVFAKCMRMLVVKKCFHVSQSEKGFKLGAQSLIQLLHGAMVHTEGAPVSQVPWSIADYDTVATQR